MAEQGWENVIRYDVNLRRDARKRSELTEQHLARIRYNRATKRIVYPDLSTKSDDVLIAIKSAYDYVNDLYPNAGIKNIVALHAQRSLLEECGYRGVGGFYDVQSRVIVISNSISATENNEFDIRTEYTIDEVLCHEMIHYGANYDKPLGNRHLEEEIAYGKTAGYLRAKGRSDKFIIEKNMMPYLISVVDRPTVLHRVISKEKINLFEMSKMSQTEQDAMIDKLRPKLAKEMLSMAQEMGQRLIELYHPTQNEVNPGATYQFMNKRKLILDDDE